MGRANQHIDIVSRHPQLSLKSLLIAVAVFAALFAMVGVLSRHLPKNEQMQLVRVGMTKHEVADILGPPEWQFGEDYWIYRRDLLGMQEPNRVEFGPDGRVIQIWRKPRP